VRDDTVAADHPVDVGVGDLGKSERGLEEHACCVAHCKERIDLGPERIVASAGTIEEIRTCFWRDAEGVSEDLGGSAGAVSVGRHDAWASHAGSPRVAVLRHCPTVAFSG
jgi:hypothetical protein